MGVCVPARAPVCLNKTERVMSLEEKDVVRHVKQVETLVTTRKGPHQPKRGWGLLFSRGLVKLLTPAGSTRAGRLHAQRPSCCRRLWTLSASLSCLTTPVCVMEWEWGGWPPQSGRDTPHPRGRALTMEAAPTPRSPPEHGPGGRSEEGTERVTQAGSHRADAVPPCLHTLAPSPSRPRTVNLGGQPIAHGTGHPRSPQGREGCTWAFSCHLRPLTSQGALDRQGYGLSLTRWSFPGS